MKSKKKRKQQILQTIRQRYTEKKWRKRPRKQKNKPIAFKQSIVPRRIRRQASYIIPLRINGSIKKDRVRCNGQKLGCF